MSVCSSACRSRDDCAARPAGLLSSPASASATCRRRAARVLGIVLLALVTGTKVDATLCVPKSSFSCCTQAACSQNSKRPCCKFLVGSEYNDEATCAALGELFMNDWGMAHELGDYYKCYPGWYGTGFPDMIVDYTNDVNNVSVVDQLAELIADYATVTTTDLGEAHGGSWRDAFPLPVPSGWVGAAVGVHTDYCTFSGVRCDSQGRVITLCAPPDQCANERCGTY